ncbi:putative ribonuclease H-like domain-containing protein [Tanacetum coccineum]
MLANSKLPTIFWAEAVNTACYVQNRVLVVKPHNKTPYELFRGKFDGKLDEGFFIGYSLNSKAFRVYNIRTRKVEENLHIRFLEDKPIIAGDGPKWLFDIDVLTKSMNYVPVVAGTNSNAFVGTEENVSTGHCSKETGSSQDYILMLLWKDSSLFYSSSKNAYNDEPQPSSDAGKNDDEVTAAPLKATHDDFFGDETELDMSNITTTYLVPSTPNTRIHKDHSLDHVISDVQFGVYKNKKDERGIVIKNKARLVAQGYTQEEGIDYDEVFAPVTKIEAIRLFLAYASFKDFVVYQMDVKSAFLYGKIEEEVYVCQPPGFEDPKFPDKVSKVEKALYGLHQAPRACQDKYVDEILKKFGFSTVKTASTPMETSKPLLKDAEAEDVDVHLCRSMIGSLMYLTASRPDIMFVDSPFDLEAYTDSVYAGSSLERKSITGGCQSLKSRLISWQCKKQTIVANSTTEAEYVVAATKYAQMMLETAADDAIQVSTVGLTYYCTLDNGEMEITATIDGKVKIITEASIMRHLKLEDSDGISNLPTTEIFKQLALMGNMKRVSKGYTGVDIPLFPTMLVQGPIFQGEGSTVPETKVPQPISLPHTNVADKATSTSVDVRYGGAATTVTGLEVGHGSGNINKTPTMSHDSPLPRVHTLRSDEGRMQHNELMDLVTKLSDIVVALETDLTQTKKVYGAAFIKLIKKVKRLEKKYKLSKSRRKLRLMGVSTASTDFTTANVPVTTASAEISTANPEVKTAGDSVDDIATESLVYIRRSIAKTNDKGKGVMEEFESDMTKKKGQQKQERLARSFNIEEWEDIQAIIEADEELAQRLQAEEREKYSEAEKARLLAELINQRKRHFAQQRAKERRNKPPTQAQQRTYMSNYIKHMGSYTLQQIVPKIADGSTKRAAEEELSQQSSKKQKSDELSQEELQQLMIIVPEEGMNIEALQTKYPIIDWEVYTKDSRMYWKIIQVGNHTKVYQVFEDMLKNFNKDDLVKLWSLIQERFNSTEPTEDKEIKIWVELKRLFEPDADDEVWKSHKHIQDITWRLYDTCGMHHVSTKDGIDI